MRACFDPDEGLGHDRVPHGLRDVLANVLRQDTMDQRLVAHVAAPGFNPEALQYLGIETNGDEPPRLGPKGGPSDASHRAELFGRRLRNVRKVNRSPGCRTPHALCGWHAVR